jgi:poly(3-hydroxyoctanoate) depolymerase
MNDSRASGYDTQEVQLRGLRVHVRRQGEGPPLLLLNGSTRPLESWEPVMDALSGRTILSFDAPGVGGSPTPILPLSISMLAAIAAAVLDSAGLDTADVLGFSHGGAVAQQLAIDAPAKVGRLILVSTSCGIGATPGNQDALRSLLPPTPAHPWPDSDAVGTLWHFLGISSWSSIPFLGAIRTPTLVVCGSYDRVVPPANSILLAQRIPGAELVMLPAGHDLQRKGTAGALAATVETFLASGRVPEPAPVGS